MIKTIEYIETIKLDTPEVVSPEQYIVLETASGQILAVCRTETEAEAAAKEIEREHDREVEVLFVV
jgi:hypothetical protein